MCKIENHTWGYLASRRKPLCGSVASMDESFGGLPMSLLTPADSGGFQMMEESAVWFLGNYCYFVFNREPVRANLATRSEEKRVKP